MQNITTRYIIYFHGKVYTGLTSTMTMTTGILYDHGTPVMTTGTGGILAPKQLEMDILLALALVLTVIRWLLLAARVHIETNAEAAVVKQLL